MIDPKDFYQRLKLEGLNFFAGVPDSLLSSLCAYIDDHVNSSSHIITANEGAAIGVACGYHLATGKIPVVYMQNSGLGNTVNPLLSIADSKVYKIPILMIVGWRGEPGVSDEPQHIKQGIVTEKMLDVMDIPYLILDSESDFDPIIDQALSLLRNNGTSVALLIKKKTFESYKSIRNSEQLSKMSREDAITRLLELFGKEMIISTTGKTSREVYEIRSSSNQTVADFLTVGGMGHTSSIALGACLARTDRKVVCLDGDGSLIMHMGSSAIIGQSKPENLIHILINNSAHESVGGQPTAANEIDFKMLAESLGYEAYFEADSADGIKNAHQKIISSKGPIFFHIKVKVGSRPDLGRPDSSPEENKVNFMKKFNTG